MKFKNVTSLFLAYYFLRPMRMLPHKKPMHHRLLNKMEIINEIHCTEIRLAVHQALAVLVIVLVAVLATIQIIVERIVAVKNVHCVIA